MARAAQVTASIKQINTHGVFSTDRMTIGVMYGSQETHHGGGNALKFTLRPANRHPPLSARSRNADELVGNQTRVRW